MTVEIKELVIRAVAEPGSPAPRARRDEARPGSDPDAERDALVAACVRQVLEVLRRDKER